MKASDIEKRRIATRGVHAGIKRSQFGELSEAMFLTQGFAYASAEEAEARFIEAGDDEYIYARYGNPTVAMFEERIAAIEGAEDAFAAASGMAAVAGTLFSMLQSGDHIVSSRALFGSCLYILETVLPKWGVKVTFVDGRDLEAWRSAIQPETKVVFLESLSNPTLELVDIEAVAAMGKAVGATVIVDNVFATPVFQRSIDLGADVVIYSSTKHIDGQGRCLGGVVLGTQNFIRKIYEPFNKHTGGALSPFNAWVMLKGLETLSLRCERQAQSAQILAERLAEERKVARVLYPHHAHHPQIELARRQMTAGGTVIALELSGGKPAAFRALNAMETITISNNLGDAKSLATHPSTTTHQRLSDDQKSVLGVTEGLIRLSVGLEDVEDLWDDLSRAISAT
ncbi:MAG: O-succinylhomoserine sulfhydrylase [Pseudomonadota bacterium]